MYELASASVRASASQSEHTCVPVRISIACIVLRQNRSVEQVTGVHTKPKACKHTR